MSSNQNDGAVSLRIIRGPLDSLSLYEITDYELSVLEEGSPSSTFLNFAIFFFSIGASFLTTLMTVEISPGSVFTVFVVLAVIGIAASAVLFVLWHRTRSKVKELIMRIKARVPTVPIADAIDSGTPASGVTEANG